MFCTVNEHLDKEEGIPCLKANYAFKQPSILSSCFVHSFLPSDTLHFTSDLMFSYFKFCFPRKDSAPQLCTAELPLELHTRGLVVFWPFIHWISSRVFSTQNQWVMSNPSVCQKNNEDKESWNPTATSLGKGATDHLCLHFSLNKLWFHGSTK